MAQGYRALCFTGPRLKYERKSNLIWGPTPPFPDFFVIDLQSTSPALGSPRRWYCLILSRFHVALGSQIPFNVSSMRWAYPADQRLLRKRTRDHNDNSPSRSE